MKSYQQTGNQDLLILNHRTSKKVLVHSVILLKGSINYTTIYLQNGKSKVVAHTLKFFENHLQTHGFLRVHRSCMINPNYIEKYDSDQEILTMTNGFEASISRRRRDSIRNFKK
jgi:DNA-binding LytR/AlgR family response regulator